MARIIRRGPASASSKPHTCLGCASQIVFELGDVIGDEPGNENHVICPVCDQFIPTTELSWPRKNSFLAMKKRTMPDKKKMHHTADTHPSVAATQSPAGGIYFEWFGIRGESPEVAEVLRRSEIYDDFTGEEATPTNIRRLQARVNSTILDMIDAGHLFKDLSGRWKLK